MIEKGRLKKVGDPASGYIDLSAGFKAYCVTIQRDILLSGASGARVNGGLGGHQPILAHRGGPGSPPWCSGR
eukprot:SAG11_NODE_3584_length_2351_cov_7.509325_1_plen_71_part_10